MTVMEVVTWPAQVLETKAKDVTVFDDQLVQLARDMHETMAHAGGIGLAANQVGILKRVIVVHIPHENTSQKPWHKNSSRVKEWHNKPYTLVNPKIISFQGKFTSMEGCLSFPDQMEYVNRHVHITVAYQDVSGAHHRLSCDGLMSVCLQHEIDHINGTLFIDRMNQTAAQSIKERLLDQASQT